MGCQAKELTGIQAYENGIRPRSKSAEEQADCYNLRAL